MAVREKVAGGGRAPVTACGGSVEGEKLGFWVEDHGEWILVGGEIKSRVNGRTKRIWFGRLGFCGGSGNRKREEIGSQIPI